jgi:hypothetical protein
MIIRLDYDLTDIDIRDAQPIRLKKNLMQISVMAFSCYPNVCAATIGFIDTYDHNFGQKPNDLKY